MRTIKAETTHQLRARLKLADSVADEQGCSLYLVLLGISYLAVEEGNEDERSTLEMLFRAQAASEQLVGVSETVEIHRIDDIDADEVLEAIAQSHLQHTEPS